MDTQRDKIEILYKYRPIDKYTIKMLVNNEFHFSFPKEFNDPFDCDASIEHFGTMEDFIGYIKKNCVNEEINKIVNILEQGNYDMTMLKEQLDLSTKATTKETIPIYCLAEKKDSILMWSHYSDKHTGICLGFKTCQENDGLSMEMEEIVNNINTQNRLFFFKVNYQDSFPRVFNPIKDDSLALFEFFKFKSKIWEYEKEYRSHIIYERFNKQEFKFSKDILSEVIFGVQTPEDDMKLIIDIVNNHYIKDGVDVKIYKAEKVKGKIEIGFKQIDL